MQIRPVKMVKVNLDTLVRLMYTPTLVGPALTAQSSNRAGISPYSD